MVEKIMFENKNTSEHKVSTYVYIECELTLFTTLRDLDACTSPLLSLDITSLMWIPWFVVNVVVGVRGCLIHSVSDGMRGV